MEIIEEESLFESKQDTETPLKKKKIEKSKFKKAAETSRKKLNTSRSNLASKENTMKVPATQRNKIEIQ